MVTSKDLPFCVCTYFNFSLILVLSGKGKIQVSIWNFLFKKEIRWELQITYTWQGCLSMIFWAAFEYILMPYNRLLSSTFSTIFSLAPVVFSIWIIASNLQSVTKRLFSKTTKLKGCLIIPELIVWTSEPSSLACWMWSSKASHQYNLKIEQTYYKLGLKIEQI